MAKSTHFFGQPVYAQLIKFLDRAKTLELSRKLGGEKYVKRFDAWHHLLSMLYAVIMRFDSLREIEASMLAEVRKLGHLGLKCIPRRSTLSDANARRPAEFFEKVYRDLYQRHKSKLCADSRNQRTEKWMKDLMIIDSTTVSLFSNLIFKGAGRNPKSGKKKGGIKVHSVIHANEGVPCDVSFTSAATHDSFMLRPSNYPSGKIVAMDRAYIDYEKFEEMTEGGVIYVTKMKKNLVYKEVSTLNIINPEGKMVLREQIVLFTKTIGRVKAEQKEDEKKDEDAPKETQKIEHRARIVTYEETKGKKTKIISLLTNDFDMPAQTIIDIYHARWQIESLFKQLKQNFPLRYFYGESANAIKIQIWVTLIANLLITLFQRGLERSWSFSGLATMMRIVLMYYININTFFEAPDEDLKRMLQESSDPPSEEAKTA